MVVLRVAQAVVAVALSVLLTAGASWLFHREVRADFLITGFFAALIINTVIDVWTTRLRDANQRLRDEVIARTAELRVARATSSVAHEVKNPLTAVIGNLELADDLLAAPLTPAAAHDVARSVQAALVAARHLHALVGDLTPGTAGEVGPVDAAAVARAAAHIAAPRVEPAGTIDVALSDLPPVLANGSRLVQVLLNLLINASLATRDGAPARIRIHGARDGDHVRITVTDEGRGMAPEVLARVFEPGFTTRAGQGGSGLGMAIARDLVRGFGGEVEIESAVGAGTSVHVRLRAAPPAGG